MTDKRAEPEREIKQGPFCPFQSLVLGAVPVPGDPVPGGFPVAS